MMTKQMDPLFLRRLRWVAILFILTLALIAGLLIASHVISIYHFDDSYTDANGENVTDRYTVKKQDGVYALFDRFGNRMEQNQEGKYIAAGSGNQYTIDPESGAWSLYAVVEYDEAVGESISNARRVLAFPQILQKDLAAVKVQNSTGSYEIYRDETGQFRVLGIDNPHVSFDTQKITAFAVGAGYPVTLRKLDFSSAGVQKNADGSVDYASYGLEKRYDNNGTLLSEPATYTVSAKDASKMGYEIDPARTYTVIVGDRTLDQNGYYIRVAGRNAIYIMSASTMESTVLSSKESLVSACAVIPVTVNTYPMVQDFLLARMTLEGSFANAEVYPIVRFDYEDQSVRTNTLLETRPYVCRTELMEGYEINDESASSMLGLLYEMSEPTCVHLGLGEGEERIQTLAAYGITGDVFYLTYHPLLTSGDGDYGYSEEDFNLLIIGPKTERGSYYVASFYYDMILEVDQYYLSFLEWAEKDWYASYPMLEDIAYLKELSFESGDTSYHFVFDNSLSYAYYIDETGTYRFPSLSGGDVGLLSNGTYVYLPSEGGKYTLYALDFDHEELYYDKTGNALLSPTVNSNYLRVFSPEAGGELDYTVLKTTVTDLGEEKYKTLTALDNFRYLWKRCLYFTIEGDIDRVSFEKLTGKEPEDYLADRISKDDADLTIRYRVEDDASSYLMNAYGVVNESGKTVKLFTENNEKDIILRFYSYSGQKAILTIEKVTEYDESGAPVEHPENTVARFYVRSDYLSGLLENAGRVVRGELVDDVN
ncbi:MAG: hypothetical protein IJR88_06640 [Clostridia bacterium]|nr:hypothetical protein [Clostridia bacterium]